MENGKQPINAIDGSHQGIHPKQLIGLTKREYFAAMAMQGLLSTMSGLENSQFVPNLDNTKYCAGLAVSAADELLKQLENK